jgi:hypothetical protein
MPNVRLDSFTTGPNADIKVWTPEVATVLYCGHLRRCDEEREGLDDESAVVEHVCAPQCQLVERALSGNTGAVSVGAERAFAPFFHCGLCPD